MISPRSRLARWVVFAFLAAAGFVPVAAAQVAQLQQADDLRVMTWNIWHGAREDGVQAGPAKAAEIIRDSGADIVALQETYGSGEILSEALRFHFHPRGTNVSILSRYPVLEDLSVHEEFQCVGALIQLPGGRKVAFYAVWLPYSGEIWEVGTRDTSDPAAMRGACDASAKSLTAMWAAIQARLAEKHAGVPVIVAGDFNSMSHLDYGEVGVDQYGVAIDWDTSHILADAGFLDSYREVHPVIDRLADATWSPRFPRQSQDRIDFIYYRAPGWRTSASEVLREAPLGFPSDHAALVSTFVSPPVSPPSWAPPVEPGTRAVRALSYNIKHGLGLDGHLDLARTASVLRASNADLIALQEVDLAAKRSGYRNQVNALAAQLGMHPAFGSFMDYQGGQYGLAALSRFPVIRADALRLPDGHEPRVALALEVQLPDAERILMVNVHFDWVDDDGFRLAQAKVVRDYLVKAKLPWILMGDFNDEPGSATLDLFREVGVEVTKPEGEAMTFPADAPIKEIDFVFHSKGTDWTKSKARVVDEKVASDHRPVLAELLRKD